MKKHFLITAAIIAFALLYRIYGLNTHSPLWVDEFSTARSARNIIQYGPSIFLFPGKLLVEGHNYTTYSIAALSMLLFGETPFALRLPFAIIGALTVGVLYLFMMRITNRRGLSLATALLAATSYNLITWSRQAREYSLLQFLIFSFLFAATYINSSKPHIQKRAIGACITIGIVGLLTHVFFYLFIIAICLYYGWLYRSKFLKWTSRSPIHILYVALLVIIGLFAAYRQGVLGIFTNQLFLANNLWYYHSYLWRQYGLLTTFGVGGLLIMLRRRIPLSGLIILHFAIHFFFITFIFTHYITKYLEPILPYLYVGMGYLIWHVCESLFSAKQKTRAAVLCVFVACAIIANGNSFVTKPKKYYSLNHDFREISNIDYDQFYSIIVPAAKNDPSVAVVETWPDRAFWYLGNNFSRTYLFRWENEAGSTNGHAHKTPFYYNAQGEKEVASGMRFISNVTDLKKTMKRYPKGYIFIDDESLPGDVIDYVKKHMKQELFLDHFPLDDNPYSIWPATLYSWDLTK